MTKKIKKETNIINMLSNLPKDFNLLEKQINVDTQMEYFKKSSKAKKNINIDEVKQNANNLFIDSISIEDKKKLLTQIASIPEVELFRILEKFLDVCQKELQDWAFLAYTESKLILESSLTKKNKVFISTGLGGKGKKLRYFIAIIAKKNKEFIDYRLKLVKDEILFMFKQNDCEIESFSSTNKFIKIKALIPITTEFIDVFKTIISNCNEIEDYIYENFIITNVNELSDNEINDFIESNN